MVSCKLCPRRCGADRNAGSGFCGGGALPRIARAALHMWEEPCISGSRGSGAVFFSGCPLRCVFCQNSEISHGNMGAEVTIERLAEVFAELQQQGAHNINLVSATQYIPQVAAALRLAKPGLGIPIVYNTGGYELPESLRLLEGLVDIYLPDLKYLDPQRAAIYSGAEDYPNIAVAAIDEMVRQTGAVVMEGGLMRRGTLVRHLVLPGGTADSLAVVRYLAGRFGHDVMLSLMSQYTPEFYRGELRELKRPLASLEYKRVAGLAAELGVRGYTQQRGSATARYRPDFGLQGVLHADRRPSEQA